MRQYALIAFCVVAALLASGAGAVPEVEAAPRVETLQPGTFQIRITSRVVSEGGGRKIKFVLRNEGISQFDIGSGILTCTPIGGGPFVTNARRCSGTYRFAKGTIEVAGTISSRAFYEITVVGGTGLYANVAAGTLTALTLSVRPRRERLDFILFAI